jgi:carbonic anhydrase
MENNNMERINEILEFNHHFVENEEFSKFQTTKFPDKKTVILSCMDTRLTELLPQAMNIKNGDAKFIKNAGAVITHPFGSIMRSILVAVYELNVDDIIVVAHHGCGMNQLNPAMMLAKIRARGVSEDTLATLAYSGINLQSWLHGFDSVYDSVRTTVNLIVHHPLIPKDINVHGLVIDPSTGKLELVTSGSAD